MCDHCGCENAEVLHHRNEEHRRIELEEQVLSKNDRLAEKNRRVFEASKVLVVNLVSSPGAGKTTLLERTIGALKDELRIGVIEGDQQTDRDAQRIQSTGVRVYQITTGDACHLDSHMVGHALDHFELDGLDLLFVENVGNLICPGSFDLGEDYRVVALSTPEGEDKPVKYPSVFLNSHLVLITKIDLLEVLEGHFDYYRSFVKKVNPSVECIGLSAKSGAGMEGWYSWLKRGVGEKQKRS
jgi:hydrogenase nickel incorporation protein HypB